MTGEEIKIESNRIYDDIYKAKERLKDLRKICKHEKTFKGNYSYRIGQSDPADICEYCGEVVDIHNKPIE